MKTPDSGILDMKSSPSFHQHPGVISPFILFILIPDTTSLTVHHGRVT
jgi:hypothetical protein